MLVVVTLLIVVVGPDHFRPVWAELCSVVRIFVGLSLPMKVKVSA